MQAQLKRTATLVGQKHKAFVLVDLHSLRSGWKSLQKRYGCFYCRAHLSRLAVRGID
jgi:hypothetical protein